MLGACFSGSATLAWITILPFPAQDSRVPRFFIHFGSSFTSTLQISCRDFAFPLKIPHSVAGHWKDTAKCGLLRCERSKRVSAMKMQVFYAQSRLGAFYRRGIRCRHVHFGIIKIAPWVGPWKTPWNVRVPISQLVNIFYILAFGDIRPALGEFYIGRKCYLNDLAITSVVSWVNFHYTEKTRIVKFTIFSKKEIVEKCDSPIWLLVNDNRFASKRNR